jgi:ferredoxin-nitrite reductase
MDIRIGGRLGDEPRFGDVVVKKVPHWELNETLLRIFTFAGRTEPEWWTQALTPVEETA